MRTRVLWVTAEPPDPHGSGGARRNAYLVEALAGWAEVEVLTTGEWIGAPGEVTEVTARPVPVPRSALARRAREAGRLLRRQPADVLDLAPLVQAMAPVVARQEAPILCVEHHGLAPLLAHAPPGVMKVVTFEYLPSAAARHRFDRAAGRRQRLLWRREGAKARAYERWVTKTADLVIAVSDDDARTLAGPRMAVVANGVPAATQEPGAVPEDPRLVLTGSLDFAPNVDAAQWFVGEVLPRIRQVVPSVRLDLVGRHPVPEVLALSAEPGVTVVADVPDVAPHLDTARVALVPVRIGSGTRIKALEAMAAGRPVVGTSIGLAGLGVEPGRHALVADDAAGFASAVVQVLTDDELARSLGLAGWAHVVDGHTWEASGHQLARALGLSS